VLINTWRLLALYAVLDKCSRQAVLSRHLLYTAAGSAHRNRVETH